MASVGQPPLQQPIVVVTGIPPVTSDAALEAYFQDKKKGGGEIVGSIKRTESAAYITFKDPNVAARLVSTNHTFGPTRAQLSLSLYSDRSRPASSSSLPSAGGSSPRLSMSFSNDLNSASSTADGAGYPSSNSSNVSEDRIRLKVSDIPPNITKTHIELYFKKQAGGVAPEVEYEANSSTAFLVYRNHEAANKVLTASNALNKLPVIVAAEDVQPRSKDVVAGEGATLIVSNIAPGISQRHIELYFKKQAGGVQPSVEYDVAAGVARLYFNDKDAAMKILGLSNALNKEPVTVTLEQQPKDDTSRETNASSNSGRESASGNSTVVFVTDIHPDVSKTYIELYFKKQAGVKPVVQYDAQRRAARLTFPSSEAARLILGQEHKLNKALVNVSLVGEAEGVSVNCIEVSNVEPKYEELVRFYFMEFGCIDSFQYHPHDKKLLLRFGDARAAEAVLQRVTHDVISNSLQVAVAPLMSDVLFEDDTTGASDFATVLVTGIPPDVHEKHVQLYFKSAALSGGGDVSSVVYAPGSGTAQITFACSSVARRVCTIETHRINSAFLSVTPLYDKRNTDLEDFMHIHGNDYRSSAIMVESIPSCVIEDHLRLYFSDCKLSGGGPIKRIYYNRMSGVAIIVFHDTEVAKRSTSTRTHRLCHHTLQVELLQNEAESTEQVFYVSGFADVNNFRESLWWWLSAAAGVSPQTLHFSENHSAVLVFFNSYVAHNVIPFSCFKKLGGRLLKVKRIPKTKTLFISNLPGNGSTMLKFYLEHPSNGGNPDCVKNIEIVNDKAYKVSLQSSDVLKSILAKDRVMEDQVLTLLPFYEEIGQVTEDQQFSSQDGPIYGVVGGAPPLLILRGFSCHSDEATVREFYESLKDEDKGNAATAHFHDGELRAQLTRADVARRIIDQSEQHQLQYNGVAISAKFRQQTLTTDMKRNMLLVRNISAVQEDHLWYFLWALSGVPVVEMSEIIDRDNKSCTLVKFARALAFTDDGALPWLPANLCGAPFDVELVPKPRCVYAKNMPAEATEEYIKMLFANSGAEVVGSIEAPNKGFIIEFCSSRDVDRVLKQRVFYNGKSELVMVAYYQPIA